MIFFPYRPPLMSLRLATIKGHSKMYCFITQHNATDVSSFEGVCNWHADCLRAVAREFNTTVCSSSCQYPATLHSHLRGVDQHYTGHNQQSDQLNAKEMCCTAWGKSGHTRYWLVFGPPQYSKTAHFRVAFYCGQPKAHLCNNNAV